MSAGGRQGAVAMIHRTRAERSNSGGIVDNRPVKALTAWLTAIFLVVLSVGLVSCESLAFTTTTEASITAEASTTSEASTTTEAPTTTTLKPVDITMESGQSPCLIVDKFQNGGEYYLVVDYIQVKWVSADWGGYEPKISNTNTKLRTFLLPADAHVSWYQECCDEDDPRPMNSRTLGVWNEGYGNGFWDIKVSEGRVVSIVENIEYGP